MYIILPPPDLHIPVPTQVGAVHVLGRLKSQGPKNMGRLKHLCMEESSVELESSSDFYLVGPSMDQTNASSPSSRGGSDLKFDPTFEETTTTLRWAFWVHTYTFGCLFFFLAFYSFFSILNLRSQLSTRPYMTTINSFLCILGASRAIVLFVDPYGLEHRLPAIMGALLWDLGFPALVSSFSLIQIAFLQLTQAGVVGPEAFRRKKTCLSLIITLHFISAIISAIYTSLNTDLMVGKLVTQLLFATWGFVLCGSFIVAGNQVMQLLSGGSSSGGGSSTTNDKGVANLMMGMMGGAAGGGGQNLASSLTAALAPTLLQGSSSSSGVGSSSSTTKDKDSTPRIKITDEHDRTVSASDSSRLNDIPELPEGNGGRSGTTPVQSPRSSFSGPGAAGGTGGAGPSSTSHVRPPSPILPRRKSSGPGLRGGIPPSSSAAGGPRRLSWRRESGDLASDPSDPRKKSLTWYGETTERISVAQEKRRASRQSFDAGLGPNETNNPDRNNGVKETLLMSSTSTAVGADSDYTLQTILSHIAYVNQTALDYRLSRKLSRTNQVHRVVKFTSYTAVLGFLVCIGELVRLISPLGLLAPDDGTTPSLWLWFILHTICRVFEFAMGATVANLTKQPVNRPAHYAYSHKHHRESSGLYL
ncbi:uncharacterized protein LOC110852659 isoform X2 [Folsomia candida]|uniref:uncharacterized protein LOC110852659 isoform X2 n=1 Tax=Folsomia candida TaxID=158441 RepID=UPI001604E4AB|nr:uncharacterized protein LOC110852659 isoform X2 [Folsomia candida]